MEFDIDYKKYNFEEAFNMFVKEYRYKYFKKDLENLLKEKDNKFYQIGQNYSVDKENEIFLHSLKSGFIEILLCYKSRTITYKEVSSEYIYKKIIEDNIFKGTCIDIYVSKRINNVKKQQAIINF